MTVKMTDSSWIITWKKRKACFEVCFVLDRGVLIYKWFGLGYVMIAFLVDIHEESEMDGRCIWMNYNDLSVFSVTGMPECPRGIISI